MAISLQADSTLPQGYILVDGQRVASVSTTGGLSATLAANTVTTSSLVSGSVTTEKIAPGAVVTADLADGAVTTQTIANSAVTAEKMSGGQTGSAPVYGCRAWVNFNADDRFLSGSETLCTIRSSGNVNRVVYEGAGEYMIYLTVAMPTSGFCCVTSTNGPRDTFHTAYPVSNSRIRAGAYTGPVTGSGPANRSIFEIAAFC